jgi:hypothetical protein
MTQFLSLLAFFILVAFVLKSILDHRTKQKIISKGMAGDEARQLLQPESTKMRILGSLKWALVLIGIGAAIVIGQIVPERMSEEITAAGIFVFAGLGFLAYYIHAIRIARNDR